VSAGRSRFKVHTLHLYVLLDTCQGIVGHREGDFDFRRYLSDIYLYVANIPYCISVAYPVAPNDT